MGMNMKEILSILLIIFIALAGIACVSASDINEAVDQDFIVSDLNETLIPIDDSTVHIDTDLGNDTVEDPDSTEIDNSTEPSEEDVVVDNSTEVVENDTVDNKTNPIVGPTIPDNNKTDENQSQDIKVLTDDELNDIANETIAKFKEKRAYWINCNYPPQWGIDPTYDSIKDLSIELNKTYGADYTIDILTRMFVMVLLDEDPSLSLIPSSIKTSLMPLMVEECRVSMEYYIRSYWDAISNKSGLDWDDLNPSPGRDYDPRFDPGPNPHPFEPVDPKC